MNANEIAATMQDVAARQGAATIGTAMADPQVAAAIRDADATRKRNQERRLMEQDEIFALFKADTTNDPIFQTLHTVNFKSMGVRVIPGDSRWAGGTKDKGELVFNRHDWDQWLEQFDTVARRLGYAKNK